MGRAVRFCRTCSPLSSNSLSVQARDAIVSSSLWVPVLHTNVGDGSVLSSCPSARTILLEVAAQTDGAHAHNALKQRYLMIIECMSKGNF